MQDTISRIYNFACSQVNQVSGPGITSLITTLQQMPKSINYPEKFFTWIENFSSDMSPLMVKNPQFSDAVTHFQFQLAPLSANLKQVKLNEDFIIVELTKWKNNRGSLTLSQVGYLMNNFNLLIKILQTTDVITRFTSFQQFINKMNAFGLNATESALHQERRSSNQQLSKFPAPPPIKLYSEQQLNHAKSGNNLQKATLQPYQTTKQGQTIGTIKVIPPEGILF